MQVAPPVRPLRRWGVEVLDEPVGGGPGLRHVQPAGLAGEYRVDHHDAPPLDLFTRDLIDDGDQGVPHPRREPAVHPGGDLEVAAGDVPRGIRLPDGGQVPAVGVQQPGGAGVAGRGGGVPAQGVAQEPRPHRPHTPGRPRGCGAGAGDDVVAVVDRGDRGQQGGVQAGLLAGQGPHPGRHLLP